jgi:signal transduction histidine kinase/DNA-binding response OmpR family regulator
MSGDMDHIKSQQHLNDSTKPAEQPSRLSLLPSLPRSVLVMLCGWLLVSCLAVLFFTNIRFAEELQKYSTELEHTAAAVEYHFERSLTFLHILPASVAEDSSVINALLSLNSKLFEKISSSEAKRTFLNSQKDIANLNRHLADQKQDLDVDVIWVLNANGDCIASSNHDRPESFVGISYADRTYFKNALAGQRGRQYAVGRQTNIPGLFFSAPIQLDGKIVGAVAVKIDITKLSKWFNRFNCFVADEAGVIILSSDSALENYALTDAAVFKMPADAREKQYKRRDFSVLQIEPLGVKSGTSYQSIHLPGSDHSYMLAQSTNNKSGYRIFSYTKVPEVKTLRTVRLQLMFLVFIAGTAVILLVTGTRRYIDDMRTSLAAAETANKAKSMFLANMSHEIRTPMNGIIGMTELCMTSGLNKEQQSYLNAVKSSADNLLAIINDILDFSKIEAGKIELDNAPFLLCATIGKTLQDINVRAVEKGLELLFCPAADIPDALIGDPGRLRQIIINLVGNAIKFSSRGLIVVSVSTVEEDKDGCLLSFSVQDEGIGIPSDKLNKIFDPFEQADISTTKSFGGTGLGLAITTNLVELFGGVIKAESEIGKGSTFTFTARFKIQLTAQPVISEQPLKGCRALVVDDVPINREFLSLFLDKLGLLVSQAESGATALKLLDESVQHGTPFNFVLSDVQMPEYSGWQLIEDIRRQPAYDSVYCILMPSAGMRGDSQRCRELKVDGYLTKPIIQSEVRDLLCLLIASGRPTQQTESGPITRYNVLESRQKLAILVAEDTPINQALIETILARFGHTVTVVENGEEAVRSWQENPGSYDLIFMDVQMPVLDGFQATRKIRELEILIGGHIPIVAMTAYAMKEDMERCRQSGMDDYISKPFHREDIVAVLKRSVNINPEVHQTCDSESTSDTGNDEPLSDNAVESIFDRTELLERLGGREEMLGRFIEMFTKNVTGYMESLASAIQSKDCEQIRIQAHTIKGASGNIAARKMWETAAAMEGHARENRLDEAIALLPQLKSDFDVFILKTAVQ